MTGRVCRHCGIPVHRYPFDRWIHADGEYFCVNQTTGEYSEAEADNGD